MSTPRKPWPMVALLCATATAGYICRVNVSTAGPLLMQEFGLSQVAMGRVFSAFLLGYAFFQVPAGMLADKWGASKLLGLAAWVWAALTIAQTFTGKGFLAFTPAASLGVFMAFRFLLGISASPTYPGSAKGISQWVLPTFQGRANGIVIASIGLGSAIAPPLVSSIMVASGWRIALIVSAIPALLLALVWRRVNEPAYVDLPVSTKTAITDSPETISAPLHSRSFILLTLSYTLQGYVGYIFVAWFYIYLVQERHFGLLTGAWMSSLPWVLSILSIPLGGYISDRLAKGQAGPVWGRRIVPMFGMGMSGILISIGAHTGNEIMAAIALAFATAFVLCVEGPFWATMMHIAGKKSGRAGGIMNMGSNLGGLISPTLTPWVAQFVGWENALHLAAVLSIVAALAWLGVKPRDRA